MSVKIAIDGPSGAGKSTIARSAASELGYLYADTGAIYRSVALYCLENSVDIKDSETVLAALEDIVPTLKYVNSEQRVFVNGEDVTDRIRTPQVSSAASCISAIPRVREFLFRLQRSIADENSVIMDGRDIGTVVLPDADLKIFLTASAEKRAKRRYIQLAESSNCPSYEKVLEDIRRRDENDSTRAVSPLRKAEDAVELDTTDMTLEESVKTVVRMVKAAVKGGEA
ncbi:MAG: (d)CMP kinase [Oscillospiraceae bacterium]|nr:(d)CMP kinase [Oscillospiraceae bacterium]